MRSFDILLVADDEAVVRALSATLQRAGHRVMSSTTIAGTVETLMRHGAEVDIIMTSTPFDRALGDDVIAYSRRFAANARFIVLHEVAGHIEDVELALARPSVPERLDTAQSWN